MLDEDDDNNDDERSTLDRGKAKSFRETKTIPCPSFHEGEEDEEEDEDEGEEEEGGEDEAFFSPTVISSISFHRFFAASTWRRFTEKKMKKRERRGRERILDHLSSFSSHRVQKS